MERGIDQSGACDVNGRLPESNSMKGVAAASDVRELPKEMNGMRIRGDGNDDHDSSVMVFLEYIFPCEKSRVCCIKLVNSFPRISSRLSLVAMELSPVR